MKEQIISQIEQGFSLIQNISQIVNYTLQNAQIVKMHILKQIFKRKLVPQDPYDDATKKILVGVITK